MPVSETPEMPRHNRAGQLARWLLAVVLLLLVPMTTVRAIQVVWLIPNDNSPEISSLTEAGTWLYQHSYGSSSFDYLGLKHVPSGEHSYALWAISWRDKRDGVVSDPGTDIIGAYRCTPKPAGSPFDGYYDPPVSCQTCPTGQFFGKISQSCKPVCNAGTYLSRAGTCEPAPGCPTNICANPHDADPDIGCVTCENEKKKKLSGDPINTATGNKFEEAHDLTWGPGQTFKRIYNSQNLDDLGMGPGWRYSWSRRIVPVVLLATLPPNLSDIDPDAIPILPVTPTGSIDHFLVERDDGRSFAFGLTGQPLLNQGENTYTLSVTTSGFTVFDGFNTETYDHKGRLLQVQSCNGQTYTLTYDLQTALLSQVTDSFGHILVLGSSDEAHLSIATTGLATVHYGYDASSRLVSATYADGNQRTYLYENSTNPYWLTGLNDETGTRFAAWSYDAQGHASTSINPGGVAGVSLAFGGDQSVGPRWTDETDPLGTVRRHNFILQAKQWLFSGTDQPAVGTIPEVSSKQTYDANGNLASFVDFNGVVTNYTYDLTRNLETSRTEGYGTPQARTITTTWHPTFRLPAQVTEPNRVTNYTYDANGNLLTKAVTASGATRSWNYTYNNFGQVLTATDPDSNKTTYTYDSSGNLTTLTDAKGHLMQFTSYDPNGNLLAMTDPNGKVTTFSWDARNRLKSRQSGSDLTSYTYDLVGQLISVVFPDGSSVTYTYDPAHRLTNIADSHGNSIAYTLDAAGNHIREDVSDPAGQLAAAQSQVTASQSLPNVVVQ